MVFEWLGPYDYLIERGWSFDQALDFMAANHVTFINDNVGKVPPDQMPKLEQLSLLDTTGAIVCQQAQADVDVTSWLPGDRSVVATLRLPADLQAGQYTLGLALVDAASDKAAIRLAIDAPHTDRLYRLSSVRVE